MPVLARFNSRRMDSRVAARPSAAASGGGKSEFMLNERRDTLTGIAVQVNIPIVVARLKPMMPTRTCPCDTRRRAASGRFPKGSAATTKRAKNVRFCGSGVLTGRGDLQPHIHQRNFPVIGLVQNVQQTVAVEIGHAGFMKTHPGRKNRLAEIALAVAE